MRSAVRVLPKRIKSGGSAMRVVLVFVLMLTCPPEIMPLIS